MQIDSQRPPLAIVGIGAIYPGSHEAGGFWRNVVEGRDLITDVPPHYWLVEDFYDPDPRAPDKTYCKRGAFLSPVEFDTIAFGIPPANLSSTDTCQLLALVVAKQVMEDAAASFARVDRERISVILGVAAGLELVGEMAGRLQRPIWVKALREHGLGEQDVQAICDRISSHSVPWTESTFPGLLGNVVTGRIANRFDLGGTNCTCDAACASSFSALSMAANELYLGNSDMVVTGGVDTTNDPFLFLCFSKTPALSLKNDCKPFSSEADGTMLGEGIGMLALRRLEDAERDGDSIYAVIRGIGSSSDGRAKSVYAPRPEGQARALRRAYEAAGYDPHTVELVEAHGTGTAAGDVAEFEGLRQVFDDPAEIAAHPRQSCALGTIKSQMGHTKAAAGAAGMLKVALALRHRVLPPTIKVEAPDPRLKLETTSFYLNTRARPWIHGADHPRRASVSSFGFGGTNFHIALEEYVGPAASRASRRRVMPSELVSLAGSSPVDLAQRCRALAGEVEQEGEGMLEYLAYESQGPDPAQAHLARSAPLRLAVVAQSEEDLVHKLGQAAGMLDDGTAAFSLPGGVYCGAAASAGPLALLFPGQGSQYIEMGADLAMSFDGALQVWDRTAELELAAGTPLHQVVFPRPVFSEEERQAQLQRLTATQWAQPAIGAASLATLALLRAAGLPDPVAVGGHSFGEVTALHAAAVLPGEADLLRVARRRGELMAEAGRDVPASMTAVVHGADELRQLLRDGGLDDRVTIANINSPRQTVLSGPTDAIEAAEQLLKAHRLRARRLPVSTAFHSKVVQHAAGPFGEFLDQVTFDPPRIPVYANSEAAPYPDDPRAMRQLLAQQIARPVRFAAMIQAMWDAGARVFVEVGPGSVLTGLVDQCLAGQEHLALATDRKGQHGVTALWHALGQLLVAGLPLDLRPLWEGYAVPVDPRRRERSRLPVAIDGVNHGKIYPPSGGADALPAPNPDQPVHSSTITESSTMSEPKHNSPDSPTPQVAPPAPAPVAAEGWLQTFQEIQRQTAEAHAAYQRAMADSHMAFLQTAESASLQLHSVLTGQPVTPSTHPAWTPQIQPPLAPPPLPPLSEPRTMVAPTHPMMVAPAPQTMAPPPVVAPPSAAAVAALEPSPAAPPVGVPEVVDFQDLLLEVVAEKTGYPREILSMEMGLEADLGIDSIKRVEILGALQARMPGLPEVDASEIPSLQTLGQVLQFIKDRTAGGNGDGNGGGNGSGGNGAGSGKLRSESGSPVQRAVVREVAAGAGGISLLQGLDSVALVDGGSVGAALADLLGERGITALSCSAAGLPTDVRDVIFLGGLAEVSDVDHALAITRQAFDVAHHIGRRTGQGGVFVTLQDTGGDFGLSGADGDRAWLTGIGALAKSAALEWPGARVRALDLERGGRDAPTLARVVVDALDAAGSEVELGLHADGRRTTLHTEPAPSSGAGEVVLDDDAVLVVSGGARGVTAAGLGAMARGHHLRLVLLGRTTLQPEPAELLAAADDAALKRALLEQARRLGEEVAPAQIGVRTGRILAAREVRATIERLERIGAQVRYVEVDVRDEVALGRELASVREQWGAISGVIHGAGVLADRAIADKTPEQFDHVFSTKVQGLRALLAATAQDPLRLICLFSSVAARFGNVGQSDYAMANEILGRVGASLARHRTDCLVRVIDWGPWDGGMVTPMLRDHFKALGVSLIPLEVGAEMLLQELRRGDPAVEVVIGAPPPADLLRARAGGPSDAPTVTVAS